MINTTLCYIEKNGKYLMLHRIKKANDVNQDKWIGIGGKIEAKAKADSGFVLPPEVVPVTGEFTAENNKIYFGKRLFR